MSDFDAPSTREAREVVGPRGVAGSWGVGGPRGLIVGQPPIGPSVKHPISMATCIDRASPIRNKDQGKLETNQKTGQGHLETNQNQGQKPEPKKRLPSNSSLVNQQHQYNNPSANQIQSSSLASTNVALPYTDHRTNQTQAFKLQRSLDSPQSPPTCDILRDLELSRPRDLFDLEFEARSMSRSYHAGVVPQKFAEAYGGQGGTPLDSRGQESVQKDARGQGGSVWPTDDALIAMAAQVNTQSM